MNQSKYLAATYYLNYESAQVQNFAKQNCTPASSDREKAVQLYYAVRDEIKYDPYDVQPDRHALRASSVIEKGSGYCVAKAVLLTAVLRYSQIPSRLGFADVTNHLSSEKLRTIMGTDLFIYHGYTEVFINGRWLKATPAFNLSLCQRFNVRPLEFDGTTDSLFHEFNEHGQKHMEYVFEHGHYADLPFEQIFAAYEQHYPGMFKRFNELKNSSHTDEFNQ